MDTTFAIQRPHQHQTPSEAPNDYSPQQAAPPPLPGNPFPSPLLQRARIHHTPQLSPATSSFASTSSEYDPLELAPTPVSVHQPRFISPHPRTPASGKLAERLEHTSLSDDQRIEQQQLSRSAMSLPLSSSSPFYHHGVGSAAGGLPGSLIAKSPSRQEYMPAKPRMAPLPYEWSSPDGPPSPSSSDVAPFQTDEDLGVFSSPTGFALTSNGSPMHSPEASRYVDSWFSADDGGAGNIFAPSAAHSAGAHGVASPGKLFESWGEDYVSSPVAPAGNTLGSSSLARSTSAISHYPWSSSHPHASSGGGSNYSYGQPLPMSRSVSAYPAHGYSGVSQPMLASMSMPNHASMAVNPAHIAPSSSQDGISAHVFGGHVSVFSSDADDDVYNSPQPASATIGRSTGNGLNIVIPSDRDVRAVQTQAGVFQQDTLKASAALANATASAANGGATISSGMAVEATVRGPPLLYAPPIRMPNGHSRPPLALTREMWEQHNQQQASHAQTSSGPSSFHSSSWASSASSTHPYQASPRSGALPPTSASGAMEPQGMFSMMTMPRGNKGNFKFKGKVPNWEEMPTKRSRGRRPHQGGLQQRPAKLTKTGKPSTIYVCEVPACGGQIFQRSEHLKRHIASIHMDIKPFQCTAPGCDKRFSRKDNLRQHSKVHKADLALSGRPAKMSRTSSSFSEASFSSSTSSLGLSALHLARGGSASVDGSRHGSSASEVSHSGASDDEEMGSGDEAEDDAEGEGEDESMVDLLEDDDAPVEH